MLQMSETEFIARFGRTPAEIIERLKKLAYFFGEHTTGDGKNTDDFNNHFYTLRMLDDLLKSIKTS